MLCCDGVDLVVSVFIPVDLLDPNQDGITIDDAIDAAKVYVTKRLLTCQIEIEEHDAS